MKINPIQKDKSPSYKGMLSNKYLLKGLEAVSEHGTSFIAATSFVAASTLRPLAISVTPNVKKENKEYAVTNSLASGIVKFLMVEAIALPIENGIKKIDNNPKEYLTEKTIKTLKNGAKNLNQSRNYKFATQFFKLSSGLITAIPKSMITVALIPLFMNKIFKKDKEIKQRKDIQSEVYSKYNSVFSPSFNGGVTNTSAKYIGKLLNNKNVQKAVKKFSKNDTDIARDMTIATDILLTASFANRTKKSKKINEERKKALINNNIIATGASILGGSAIDSAIKKSSKNFIDKFTQENKNNPKLNKYIEGINIIRPTLIFAAIYYGILPIISTYLADKTDN